MLVLDMDFVTLNTSKMNTRIEKLIPKAIKVIEDVEIANTEGKVKSEFKGYIASFGASIVQSGLLPAVIFYEAAESKAAQDRFRVPAAILLLLLRKVSDEASLQAGQKLSEYLLQEGPHDATMQRQVTDAAIALKIALRTFAFTNEN